MRFVQVRHEESAACMACAYAKFTGRLGVCLATSGPGAVHLLSGFYDAKEDQAPVLAITGMPYHDPISTHTQQDVESDRLFAAGWRTWRFPWICRNTRPGASVPRSGTSPGTPPTPSGVSAQSGRTRVS